MRTCMQGFRTKWAADWQVRTAEPCETCSTSCPQVKTQLRDSLSECACLCVRKRLDEMLGHMKERIGGKIGNQNNNAFKLRKLFAMYDTQKTGLVRVMSTQFSYPCTCFP